MALIPFTLGDLVLGSKFSVIIFSALVAVVFFWLLRKMNIKFPAIWLSILLFISPFFILRLTFQKPTPFALILLPIGFYLILKKKHALLGILSFIFVWTYTAFPFLVYLCLLHTGVVLSEEIFKKKRGFKKTVLNFENYKNLVFCLSGTILGLVINPYFPNILKMYYAQIVNIAFLTTEGLSIGGEWYPFTPDHFVGHFWILILVYLASIAMYIKTKDRNPAKTSLLLFSLTFMILMIKSKRYADYWVPFSVLFSAVAANDFIGKKVNLVKISKRIDTGIIFSVISGILLITCFIYNVPLSIESIGGQSEYSWLRFERLKKCAEWVEENSEQGDIIFSIWYQFPALFFFNHKNYYVNGHDPTFLYLHDENLMENYNQILYRKMDDPAGVMKNDFKAKFLIVNKIYSPRFLDYVNDKPGFEKGFEDSYCTAFKIL